MDLYSCYCAGCPQVCTCVQNWIASETTGELPEYLAKSYAHIIREHCRRCDECTAFKAFCRVLTVRVKKYASANYYGQIADSENPCP